MTVLLVLTLGTAGFVLPSAPAIALASNPHRAGSAAALLGALQFGLGAVIAPLTSLGGTPTAVTMAGVMAGVIVIAADPAGRRAPVVGTRSGRQAERVARQPRVATSPTARARHGRRRARTRSRPACQRRRGHLVATARPHRPPHAGADPRARGRVRCGALPRLSAACAPCRRSSIDEIVAYVTRAT